MENIDPQHAEFRVVLSNGACNNHAFIIFSRQKPLNIVNFSMTNIKIWLVVWAHAQGFLPNSVKFSVINLKCINECFLCG